MCERGRARERSTQQIGERTDQNAFIIDGEKEMTANSGEDVYLNGFTIDRRPSFRKTRISNGK